MDTILAQKRDPAAKAKQLRRSGIVPCVISGAGLKESISAQLAQATAIQLKRTKRNGSKVSIQLDDKNYPTLIKDLEYDNINNEIIHIGFQLLDEGKPVNSVADIVLLNREKVPGILEQMQMQVPHTAEPKYLLDTVTVDLEGVPVGTVLTIGDIPEFQSENIKVQADMSNIVLRISDKKRVDVKAEQE